jgi:hypothetical protein
VQKGSLRALLQAAGANGGGQAVRLYPLRSGRGALDKEGLGASGFARPCTARTGGAPRRTHGNLPPKLPPDGGVRGATRGHRSCRILWKSPVFGDGRTPGDPARIEGIAFVNRRSGVQSPQPAPHPDAQTRQSRESTEIAVTTEATVITGCNRLRKGTKPTKRGVSALAGGLPWSQEPPPQRCC